MHSVLDVGGGFRGEEEALDESEVEEESVVRLVPQSIQETIQHLPPLRPRPLKHHPQTVPHELPESVLEVGSQLLSVLTAQGAIGLVPPHQNLIHPGQNLGHALLHQCQILEEDGSESEHDVTRRALQKGLILICRELEEEFGQLLLCCDLHLSWERRTVKFWSKMEVVARRSI